MTKKIVPGMKVYLKHVSHRKHKSPGEGIIEAEVEKVGRKYFYLKGFQRDKFSIEEMCDTSQGSSDYKVYITKQAISDEQEHSRLTDEIREEIGRYGSTKLSLKQLREIKKIISYK